jgi:hypothetical protein
VQVNAELSQSHDEKNGQGQKVEVAGKEVPLCTSTCHCCIIHVQLQYNPGMTSLCSIIRVRLVIAV